MPDTISPPHGLEPNILEDKIQAMLEANGSLSADERNRLTMFLVQRMDQKIDTIVAYLADVKQVKLEVSSLQKKSLVNLYERYPTAGKIIIGSYMLLIGLHAPELYSWGVKIIAAIAKLKY